MSIGSFKGVSRKFQECFKEVLRVFTENFKGVSRNVNGTSTKMERHFKSF